MKRNVLLFGIMAFGSIILSSYAFGPAALGTVNRTGSTGGDASCSGVGCHSANNSNTTVQIKLIDSLGNEVNQYNPGETYLVKLTGANSASLPQYGFQVSVVNSSKKQIGTFSLGSTPNDSIHRTDIIKPLQIIEHSRPLIPSIAGSYVTPNFYWIAPSSDSGNATFYVILNAVNGDFNYTGDQPNSGTPLVIAPAPTSVAKLAQNIDIELYPNPTHSNLNIHIKNATKGLYTFQVLNLNGEKVLNQNTMITNTNSQISINTTSWANGLYLVHIMKEGTQQTIQFIKQ